MSTILRALAVLALIVTSGCAVHRAANQPPRKNLDVLNVGTERDLVIAEFGTPISTEPTDSGRKDIYAFIQGYGKGAKAGRAFLHGAADVFTLGIWEIVGTPVEGTFNGKKMTVRVLFDESDLVAAATVLSVTDPD